MNPDPNQSVINESFYITGNPAADIFSSTYIEPGVVTRSKSGSNLTPKSHRLKIYPVETPIDVRRKLNIEGQRMQSSASLKWSRNDISVNPDPNQTLSNMDTKRQMASLNTSFIDPRVVKHFPDLTVQNLQMLQALSPEMQRQQLAVLGMDVDSIKLAPSQEPQEHIYAEAIVRTHSAPVRSRDSSVQQELIRTEKAGLQKQVEVLQKQMNRLQIETRRQREQLARLSTPPPPLEVVPQVVPGQVPGQVPEAGNAGNANNGGVEIPQAAADRENPTQQ
jgi:hypothetical protein